MALEYSYSVAIKIAAENAASGVLAVIAKDVLGLHGNVKDLEAGFAKWKPAIMGAAAAVAGIKLADMLGDIVEAGNRLEHFKAQMLAATGDIGKVADATNAAWLETSRNLNSSVADNVKNIQHLMAVTGSFDEAKQMLHPFTLADTALMSVKDQVLRSGLTGGEGVENNTLNFAKSLEQLGVTQDEDKLNSYIAGMTRTMVQMRGQVDGTKYLNAINNAGASRYGWDEDFVEKGLGPLIQSTNGKIGNQLYQLDRTFGQGVASSITQAHGAEKYGFWSESDEIWEAGRFKGMKPNSGFEPDVRKANPVQWAGDVREMLKARGVNIDDTNEMTSVIAEVGRGNKNLGAGLSELILPKPYQALMKERTNIENTPQDAVGILQAKDPTLAMKAFHTQWENLMMALGSPLVATATSGIQSLTGVFNSLATEAAAHPEAVKGIGIALVGVAGGLTAIGTVLVGGAVVGAAGVVGVSGGLVAAIAAGAAAATAALTTWLAYKDQFSAAMTAIGSSFTAFMDKIKGFASFLSGPSASVPEASKKFQQDRQNLNPLFHHSSFTDPANDNSPLADAVYAGFMKAFQEISGGTAGAAGGAGTGSGIINAAYTTFGDSGTGTGARSAAGGDGMSLPGASATQRGAVSGTSNGFFQAGAPSGAVDVALGMVGENEIRNRAQVNSFLNQHGSHIDAAQTAWCAAFVNSALDAVGIKGTGSLAASSFERWGRSVGLNDVHKGDVIVKNHHVGLATGEIDKFGRIGMVSGNHGNAVGRSWEDPRAIEGIRRAVPTAGAPPRQQQPIVIHHNTHLDGKIVASNTSRHQKQMAMFPTAVGGMDTYGSFASPGTPMTDAA